MIIFVSDNGGRLDVANNGPFRGLTKECYLKEVLEFHLPFRGHPD